MQYPPDSLRENVRNLGEILGNKLSALEGPEVFDKVEQIRSLSKAVNETDENNSGFLVEFLSQLEDEYILPIARSFNQFLNLVNVADQDLLCSTEMYDGEGLEQLLASYVGSKGKQQVLETLTNLRVELVLTAHPTEVARRTIIQKYDKIAEVLSDRRRSDMLPYEQEEQQGRLERIIEEIWSTDEFRNERPTAEMPVDFQPFKIFSWMGGDRDGNPNVTHSVTHDVIFNGRLMAARFYLQDVQALAGALSMAEANSELRQCVPAQNKTPYRFVLSQLQHGLKATLEYTQARLLGKDIIKSSEVISSSEELLKPLKLCYQSLCDVGLKSVASGPLKDLIRKVHCFGINLAPLDIRQDAERHVELLSEIVDYLGIGSYKDWSEQQRLDFLLEQLQNKRPLFPRDWPVSSDSLEVLQTCAVIANEPRETLSNYVISMAQQASDVLAVALILKESGMKWSMPVVPLFETLDDLDRAADVMEKLWNIEWYRNYTDSKQTVMIGYSDSAKDAGKLSATWSQYKTQEKLVALAESLDIDLILFHGRGGTVGRGGGPVEKAMASQPPGSVKGKIRVTEQGEMIRYKFGQPKIAFHSLSTYASATIRATIAPHEAPRKEWRELIEEMAQQSLEAYRSVVRGHDHFVPYFRSLTPEQELNKLALGSRPAKRKATGGVESLRAIPWVFAWTQVRLNLPAWLGVLQALQHAKTHHPDTLQTMIEQWPFFASFIDLMEMVVGKADNTVCFYYEQQLVPSEYRGLGKTLRADLKALEDLLNELKNQNQLLDNNIGLQLALKLRKPYIDPLNYLQAELLKRERKSESMSPDLERALKVTMAGVSAGMRNTG